MKRVLVVGISDNPGGIESVVMNYYRHLDKSKFQLDFLCNTDIVAYEDEIKKLGGKIYKITAKSKNIKKYRYDLRQFFEVHATEYDAIWANYCNITNIDYLKFAKKYNIKKRIIHAHNSRNMSSKLRGLMHDFNRLFVSLYATDFWACSYDASKWSFPKKVQSKVVIVNNAIDISSFKYSDKISKKYREDLNLEGKFIIGNVGRLHFQKNQLFLLDIFDLIHKKDPDSELVLIGQGEDEEKIKDKIRVLGLNDCVKMLGARNDVKELMMMMDVFLFPSVFEGLGLVLIEAQASGLPIVASSDRIPKDVKISPNFTFVSLDDSIEKWSEEVLKYKNTSKNNNVEALQDAGYDIKVEIKKIEKLL